MWSKLRGELNKILTRQRAARFVRRMIAPDAQRHAIARISEDKFAVRSAVRASVFGVALSTCTCTRAGTALPPVRDAARRISVSVSKSISINLTQVANALYL